MTTPTLADLLKRTTPGAGGCLMWTGAKTKRGYPVVKSGGRAEYVHRLVYRLSHGKLAAGQVIDQTCGHPACIKPGHLEAKSQQANIARAGSLGHMARD